MAQSVVTFFPYRASGQFFIRPILCRTLTPSVCLVKEPLVKAYEMLTRNSPEKQAYVFPKFCFPQRHPWPDGGGPSIPQLHAIPPVLRTSAGETEDLARFLWGHLQAPSALHQVFLVLYLMPYSLSLALLLTLLLTQATANWSWQRSSHVMWIVILWEKRQGRVGGVII